jgi:DNA ligase (NAD+)
VIREENEVATRCTGNFKCTAQVKERLNHFVSRHAFDIEGLGGKSIDFFWEINLIKNPIDIFTLQERDARSLTPLRNFPGWGQKSAENLFQAIEEKRHITFDRFLYALGIHHIGQVTAKVIARHYKTPEDWNNAMTYLNAESSEEFQNLLSIDSVGHTIATSLMLFFREPSNRKLVNELISLLDIISMVSLSSEAVPLKGKTILFTGTLQSLTREEAKNQAEHLGAKVTNTISPKTHILVVGENPGSKLEKAKKLNIKIFSENEWVDFLKQFSS